MAGAEPGGLERLQQLAAQAGIAPPRVREARALGYRHRVRLAVRGRANNPKIGLFELGSHRVVHIPDCKVHHPLINDVRALAWMANQNCITPHVWNRRLPELDRPDLCVFDLDPARDEPAVLRAAALALRDRLAARGLPSWVKTTGSKGFHIVVRGQEPAFAHEIAAELIAADPRHLTLAFHKADRGGRILVDIGRNGYGATFAAPYAVRPRPGAPVSAPCTWDEVASGAVGPTSFTLASMPARLDAVGDLWADLHGE
jgi:bifunctional non-homologous end joining protein LigD